MTRGYRKATPCPVCGYYDHGGKMDKPRCVGFLTNSGAYCSVEESPSKSKNFWGADLYYHSEVNPPTEETKPSSMEVREAKASPSPLPSEDSLRNPLTSPQSLLGLKSKTPTRGYFTKKRAKRKDFTKLLPSLPVVSPSNPGFCKKHSSHFCPDVSPWLYERGLHKDRKGKEVPWD